MWVQCHAFAFTLSEVQSFAGFMLRGNLVAMVPSALIPMVQIPQVAHRAARQLGQQWGRTGDGRHGGNEEGDADGLSNTLELHTSWGFPPQKHRMADQMEKLRPT